MPYNKKIPNEKNIKFFTCEHYESNCQLKTNCCNKTFDCRRCHDAVSDHLFNRFSLSEIICKKCHVSQQPSNKCENCEIVFALYFCAVCCLWSSSETYHCEGCNLCKKGDRNETFHCEKCNACLPLSLKDKHVHIENLLESSCLICGEYLSWCSKRIAMLKCSHIMHEECLGLLRRECSNCPICKGSMANHEKIHEKIQKVLKIFKGTKYDGDIGQGRIECFDCYSLSEKVLHNCFNFCEYCFSYNTRIVESSSIELSDY